MPLNQIAFEGGVGRPLLLANAIDTLNKTTVSESRFFMCMADSCIRTDCCSGLMLRNNNKQADDVSTAPPLGKTNRAMPLSVAPTSTAQSRVELRVKL